jgi:hypothetical protein
MYVPSTLEILGILRRIPNPDLENPDSNEDYAVVVCSQQQIDHQLVCKSGKLLRIISAFVIGPLHLRELGLVVLLPA